MCFYAAHFPYFLDKTTKIPEKKPSESSISTLKLSDKPKVIDKPVIVPQFSNVPRPQPLVSTNQEPKKVLNPVETVSNKKVPNVRTESTNHAQPHLPKSVPNSVLEKTSSDAQNSTLRKNPRTPKSKR